MTALWLPHDVAGPNYTDNPEISLADSEWNGANVMQQNSSSLYTAFKLAGNAVIASTFNNPAAGRVGWTLFIPTDIQQPSDVSGTSIGTLFHVIDSASGAFHRCMLYRHVAGSGNIGIQLRMYSKADGAGAASIYGYTDVCFNSVKAKVEAARNGKNYWAFRYDPGTNRFNMHLNNAESVDEVGSSGLSGDYTFSTATTTLTLFGFSTNSNTYKFVKGGAVGIANSSLSDAELDEYFDHYQSLYGDDVQVR